ncbi:MAG TPA: HEAT repeat domain-containing protein, partial [Planctomycetota bacterium]|nr:HEAT repeat domain-containing protein [Planctomycetota bacterium]
KLLADPDAEVRIRAVSAARGITSEKAGELLALAMADADGMVRRAVIPMVEDMRTANAAEILIKAAESDDPPTRREAITVIGRMGLKGGAVNRLLEKAVGDADPFVQEAAIATFGQVGADEALAVLGKIAGNPSHRQAAFAASVLAKMGGDKAFAHLKRALADPDKNVRRNAVNALIREVTDENGKTIRDILLAAMPLETDPVLRLHYTKKLDEAFPDDEVVAKAIKELPSRP